MTEATTQVNPDLNSQFSLDPTLHRFTKWPGFTFSDQYVLEDHTFPSDDAHAEHSNKTRAATTTSKFNPKRHPVSGGFLNRLKRIFTRFSIRDPSWLQQARLLSVVVFS